MISNDLQVVVRLKFMGNEHCHPDINVVAIEFQQTYMISHDLQVVVRLKFMGNEHCHPDINVVANESQQT